MGYCDLYQNTELEQIYRDRKKIIDTFPKECKKTLTLNISETIQKPQIFLGASIEIQNLYVVTNFKENLFRRFGEK
jgi:pantothenate kinase